MEWKKEYAVSVLRGYNDRESYIARYYGHGNRVLRLYNSLNRAVDAAFDSLDCPVMRSYIFANLVDGIPYEHLGAVPCSRSLFYDMRGKFLDSLIKALNVQ